MKGERKRCSSRAVQWPSGRHSHVIETLSWQVRALHRRRIPRVAAARFYTPSEAFRSMDRERERRSFQIFPICWVVLKHVKFIAHGQGQPGPRKSFSAISLAFSVAKQFKQRKLNKRLDLTSEVPHCLATCPRGPLPTGFIPFIASPAPLPSFLLSVYSSLFSFLQINYMTAERFFTAAAAAAHLAVSSPGLAHAALLCKLQF